MALIAEALMRALNRRPLLLRSGLEVLRRRAPIWGTKQTRLVLSMDRVREVFDRPLDFINGPSYAPKLKLGALVLGMDVSTCYHAERAALEAAVSSSAMVAEFERLVRTEAADLCSKLHPGIRQLDLASDVIEPVLVRAMCGLFGVVPHYARSEYLDVAAGVPTMAHWLRKLGGIIASGAPAPFGLHELTERLAEEMAGYLRQHVGKAPNGSVIALLREGQVFRHREDIVRSVGGMMLAGATLIKAATLAVHQLLERETLERVPTQEFLRSRKASDIGPFVWEALRFQPPFPFLVRYCPRATMLGDTPVAAGATVIVSPLAAMFDPTRVDRPEEFSRLRPASSYLLFGAGQHRCLAEQLAARGIPELISAIFTKLDIPNAGRFAHDGTAVHQYRVAARIRTEASDEAISSDVPERHSGDRYRGSPIRSPVDPAA
jgi:cytochrome P450